MLLIVLPFPHKDLNPNKASSAFWAVTAALKKQARHNAYIITKNAASGFVVPLGEISITITFVKSDNRRIDADNLLASAKSLIDGMADALGINDRQLNPIIVYREYGKKINETRIEIG